MLRYKRAAIVEDRHRYIGNNLDDVYADDDLYNIYNIHSNTIHSCSNVKIKKDINQALYWLRDCLIDHQKKKRHGIKSYVLFP
jgi:hypothetical protein